MNPLPVCCNLNPSTTTPAAAAAAAASVARIYPARIQHCCCNACRLVNACSFRFGSSKLHHELLLQLLLLRLPGIYPACIQHC
jgi:hypothetical protein